MADHIIPFRRSHHGDTEPRRMALASIGFQWRAGMWHRGRVVLSDAGIDAMEGLLPRACERVRSGGGAPCLRRAGVSASPVSPVLLT